jgi:thioredoxin 1
MKKARIAALAFFALLAVVGALRSQFFSERSTEATVLKSGDSASIPVKGMVTMIDLGANECVPCKMMAPIMEKVEKMYKDKAAIVFIDVWKDKAPARRFGIRAIPTQIFFDKEGKEVYRHEGFMSEAAIVSQLKKMGVS